jgi:hypothetical protein
MMVINTRRESNMNDEIKSAREIAMEKIAEIGEASQEERLKWRYVPEGEKLAARYAEEDFNLLAKLGKYEGNIAQYVREGATGILVRNISIPKDDIAKKNNKRALEGLKILKNDKVGVENVFTKMRRVFSHYAEQGEQQKQQAYESLKVEFMAKLQQAFQQQTGLSTGMKIDVEKQPQFQEEWRRVQAQMDTQYIAHLNEYKQELLSLS